MATFTGTNNVVDVNPKDLGDANINYEVTPVVVLLTTGATPPANSMKFLSEVPGEVADADYARQTLTGVSWQQVGNLSKLVSAPAVFTASTASITAKWWVLGLTVGTDVTSPVVAWGLLDGTGADDKVVNPPDSITITPDGTNGWNYVAVQ